MKEIKGQAGLYSITEGGQVWSVRARVFLALCEDNNGYPIVHLLRRRHVRVHRLVAEAFIPNPDNKPEVNHKNGRKNDNHVENLEWVTHQENMIHAVTVLGKKSPGARGDKNGRSVLTANDIPKIRLLREQGMTLTAIGAQFGVSFRTIWDITTRRRWAHV